MQVQMDKFLKGDIGRISGEVAFEIFYLAYAAYTQ